MLGTTHLQYAQGKWSSPEDQNRTEYYLQYVTTINGEALKNIIGRIKVHIIQI